MEMQDWEEMEDLRQLASEVLVDELVLQVSEVLLMSDDL